MAKTSSVSLPTALARLAHRIGKTRVIALGVAASIAIIMTACANDATVLQHGPASAFSLSVSVSDQAYSSDSMVDITVTVLAAGKPARFSAKQRLTCNGVTLQNPEKYNLYEATVTRQPTGGVYTFVYTDDQGQNTTFTVPSIGRMTVISPAAGAVVLIPQPAATPTDPASTPSSTYAPLSITYTPPTLPAGAKVVISFAARSGTEQDPYLYGSVDGPDTSMVTGTYTLIGDNFAKFRSGNGMIGAYLVANWSIPSDFQSVAAMYTSAGVIPITWAAPLQ